MFGFRLAVVSPLAIVFGMTAAQASVIEWTLQNFTFDDGGKATGSFLFDTDTLMTSDINITTSGGTYPFGGLYTMSPIGTALTLERSVPGGTSFLSLGGLRGGSLSAAGTTLEIGPLFGVSSNGEDFTPTGSVNSTNSRNFVQPQTRVNGFLTSQVVDSGGGQTGDGSTGGGSTDDGITGDGGMPEVAPVPLPAGVWFLMAALGGLGILRRRQTA